MSATKGKNADSVTLTADHCETGAPAINPKRPFGNSGVAEDVIEILGWESKRCPHCNETLDETQSDRAMAVYLEIETALDIVLSTGSFVPGVYRQTHASGRGGRWTLVRSEARGDL